jgi:hypothetical protein
VAIPAKQPVSIRIILCEIVDNFLTHNSFPCIFYNFLIVNVHNKNIKNETFASRKRNNSKKDEKNIGKKMVKPGSLIDLSLTHRLNIDDFLTDFHDSFLIFRNGYFKVGKILHIHQLCCIAGNGDYLSALTLNNRNIRLC